MTKEEKIARARERRQNLSELSKVLKTTSRLAGNEDNVNKLLLDYYRNTFNVTELNTFDQWNEKGYSVKRGETSYMVWGSPLNINKKQDGEQPTMEAADEDSKKDFFPVCHLFDIKQVHQLNKN